MQKNTRTVLRIMAEGEGEDSFGSLIKFCQATSSQELKFQTCSFARESETFPDYFDSLATSSPDPTPLEPAGIVMVSPPETDSENNSSIDKNTNRGNEDFLTPPEHHNPSCSSSQEDLQCLKLPAAVDSKVSASVFAETVACDDGLVDNDASIDLGKGEKNLGFPETEKLDSREEVLEGSCWDGVNEVDGNEGFECESKRFRAFDSELNEPTSKKARVSDENAEVRQHGEAWENVQEVLGSAAESVEEVQKSKNCGSDVNQREKEKAVDLDGADKCPKLNGSLALEESEDGVKNNRNIEAQRDGKAVSGSSSIEKIEKFRYGAPGTGVNCSIKERAARGKHEVPSSVRGKKKDMAGEENSGNTEEVKKSKNSGCDSSINQRKKENGVADKYLKVNGDLALAESEERVRDNINNMVQRHGKAVSGSSSIETIEKFRYEGPGNGVDHFSKERVTRGRRELPSSISEKEDPEGEEKDGNMKVQNGSWTDLVDVLEVVLGKVNDGCEDVDFLETAKRRGLTFPKPRWI